MAACPSQRTALLTPSAASSSDDTLAPPFTPKVFIISMFKPEADVWYRNLPDSGLGNLTARSFFVAGLSMKYPLVHCTSAGDICQATLGEGEINAAASMSALLLSPQFALSGTYFLLAGIAGVNPNHSTLGGVALARFAVQAALQYEIDSRSVPSGWATGYFALGTQKPFEYPAIAYGTEVFELNADLRDVAYALASVANLTDARGPREYGGRYNETSEGKVGATAAMGTPTVVRCDSTTSDVYFSGKALAEAFERTTSVWTNGTGVYCMTAQEDNACLEVMVRAAIEKRVDFSRIILMRTAVLDQNGFEIAIENIYRAGMLIVHGIIVGWDETFDKGIPAKNYIGDILGSLGGQPDFGLGSITGGRGVSLGGVDGNTGQGGYESHVERRGRSRSRRSRHGGRVMR
uniref:Purine nucleoside permease n=1 Tax=Bionectria ochroleuca TaxID=29856 RepID=A0A8H7TQ62_BIOOC